MTCTSCAKWIPKQDGVFKPKGTANYYRHSNFPKNNAVVKSKVYDFHGKVHAEGEDIVTSAQRYQKYELKKDSYIAHWYYGETA